jgi:hypothetical protein
MLYFGFVTISSKTFCNSRLSPAGGGSKLMLSVGFLQVQGLLELILVRSRRPSSVILPVCAMYLVVPTAHFCDMYDMSGAAGRESLTTSIFVIGSFFTNSKKPPCGSTPVLATAADLNLWKGLSLFRMISSLPVWARVLHGLLQRGYPLGHVGSRVLNLRVLCSCCCRFMTHFYFI